MFLENVHIITQRIKLEFCYLYHCVDCYWSHVLTTNEISNRNLVKFSPLHVFNFFQCIFLHKVCMYGVLIKICSIFHNVGFHYNFELNMLVIMFPYYHYFILILLLNVDNLLQLLNSYVCIINLLIIFFRMIKMSS